MNSFFFLSLTNQSVQGLNEKCRVPVRHARGEGGKGGGGWATTTNTPNTSV